MFPLLLSLIQQCSVFNEVKFLKLPHAYTHSICIHMESWTWKGLSKSYQVSPVVRKNRETEGLVQGLTVCFLVESLLFIMDLIFI